MKVLPGSTADQTIYATDADGDALAFSKGTGPDYMSVSIIDPGTGSATGQIHLAPPADAVIDAVTASVVVDDGGLQDQASFSIVGIDNPPVLTQPSDMTVEPSRVADQGLQASDADQDPLTFSLARGPWFVTVTATGPGLGNVHLTPVIADTGSYHVSVAVSDGIASDVRTFSVQVPSNTTPTFDPVKDMTVTAGQDVVQNLVAHDADGQFAMFYKVSGPGYMSVGRYRLGLPGVAYGYIELKPQLSDAPSPDSSALDVPASVEATDGTHTIEQALSIHVTFPQDHPPVLQPLQDLTVYEGWYAGQDLYASDPDQEPISFSVPNGPSFVRVGYFRLEADPGYRDAGTYTVTVRATDSRGLYDEKSFQLVVLDVPAPPVIQAPVDMAVFAGRTADQDLHATDPDGYSLTFKFAPYTPPPPAFIQITTVDPGKGTALGRIHLAPTQDDIGLDSVGVAVSNPGQSGTAYFRVQVFPPLGPALMEIGDFCMIPRYDSLAVRVLAIDPNGKPLSFSQTGLPGRLTDNRDGTATLALGPYSASMDTFVTVTATNGSQSFSEIIGVTVGDDCSMIDFGEPRDHWPIPVPGGPYTGLEGIPIAFDGTGSNDADHQTLRYAWNFGDGAVALGANPTHAYRHTGKYTVALLASDGIVTNRATTTANIAGVTPARAAPMVFPNPFNGEAVLSFSIRTPGHLRVSIFDIQGRLVRTILERSNTPAGDYDVTLDGREQNGARFASGLYFYRIESADGEKTGRFAVMK